MSSTKMAEEQNQNQQNNDELKIKFEQCEKLRDEYLDGWKRAKADLINYKKEEAQRMEQFFKFSNEQMITELIIVLDSFDIGLKLIKKEDLTQNGMQIIKNQMEELLKRYGLEKIKVVLDDVFDPMKHEAIGEEESEKPPNTIIEEVASGYSLNGKIIRPARVKVSKQKGI